MLHAQKPWRLETASVYRAQDGLLISWLGSLGTAVLLSYKLSQQITHVTHTWRKGVHSFHQQSTGRRWQCPDFCCTKFPWVKSTARFASVWFCLGLLVCDLALFSFISLNVSRALKLLNENGVILYSAQYCYLIQLTKILVIRKWTFYSHKA